MCDTFICKINGKVYFGKNSDREPDEAQNLEFYPGREYSTGEELNCTYITIPQVKKTCSILISKPFWMWGAEMGINEHGVVIGNEAIFTNQKSEKPGLTGMDLLRLGLERGVSASAARDLIIELLEEFGQGGHCGYRFQLEYMNSYIIADSNAAFVLEIYGREWAWKEVTDYWNISNMISLESEFDSGSEKILNKIRNKKNSLKKELTGKLMTWAAGGKKRAERGRLLLENFTEKPDLKNWMKIFRDHDSEDSCNSIKIHGPSICFHAAGKLFNRTQTVCSFIAVLKGNSRTILTTGCSNPCISPYFPVKLNKTGIPELYRISDKFFQPDSFWWFSEAINRNVILCRSKLYSEVKEKINRLEVSMLKRLESAPADLDLEFRKVLDIKREILQNLKGIAPDDGQLFLKRYWKNYNKLNRIPDDLN